MSDLLNQASLVMVPSGYKEDTVYSVVPSDGSGDLAFTRASNGTRVNSAGLVEVCPWNLLQYSEDFSNGVWATYGTGTITTNTTTAPNGTTTADKFTPNTTNTTHACEQNMGTTSGAIIMSLYAKADGYNWLCFNSYVGGFKLTWFNISTGTIGTVASGVSASIESVGNGWYRCIVSLTGGASTYFSIIPTNANNVSSFAGDGTSGIFIWGAQLNIGSTAKPYFPTTDRLNVPRLTYQNGGGGCPSLLLEKQSTNLITYSEQFDNAAWSTANANGTITRTANYGISPDGTQNADRIQFTRGSGGSDYAQVYQQVSTTSGTHTFSCWIKSLSGTPSIGWAYNGAVWDVVTLTNEWVRYTWTTTTNTNPSANLIIYGSLATPLSADFLVWGYQIEASSYPTSYIPTTSSSATRVADGSPDTATLLSNKLSYSVFLDFYPRPLGNFQYFFIQKNSSANAEIIWGGTSGGTDFAIYDYTTGSICNVAINDGNRHKIVLSQASGKIDVFVDGSQVATQKTTSATGFYYVAFDGNPGIYKINELAIMSKITNADAIALTTL